jgi:hypothetical protein
MQKRICKLCMIERPLCRSHLMPRAAYALCRAQKARNPNPLMVTHNLVLQTSRHLQDHLLCLECEQLLRKKGEDWVIPQLARVGDVFPLAETLKASPHLFNEPDVAAYALEGHPTIAVGCLIHFAMGIFWKAAVHNWLRRKKKSFITLGEYQEPVRKFLLGQEQFPNDMALSLSVLRMPVKMVGFQFPYETVERPEDRTFHLYISGMNFTLWVGKRIPAEIALVCVTKRPNLVLVYDVAPQIVRRYKEAFANAKRSNKVKLK